MSASVVWFRSDLRLADHRALTAALERRQPIIPVFIWSPEEEAAWRPGAASNWWLHQSLQNLDAGLRRLGSRLIVRQGPALNVLHELGTQTKADAIFWNRRYEPAIRIRDERIQRGLRESGVAVETLNSTLLFEPSDVRSAAGRPYQVFTPFWRACLAAGDPPKPIVPPKRVPCPKRWPDSLPLQVLGLEPMVQWTTGIHGAWTPGEAGARSALGRFLKHGLGDYPDSRDRPDVAGTSRLSPYLHFGEISVRHVWHAVRSWATRGATQRSSRAASAWLRQLGWREFAHHLLHHFPHTSEQPLRPEFASFPWRDSAESLRAWQRGRTGYPIVDAGMRELWTTGWMHNRLRMIVASFLVKDLLIPWQRGAEWFWDTLVDADLANNTLGWQWTAGCGADAAPFFRVFNSVNQGEKFDPDGQYIRRWVPELAKLPVRWIHKPWEAPSTVLRDAGVGLGETYPVRIVDHRKARERALRAFAAMKRQ